MFYPKLETCLKDYSRDKFISDFIAEIIVGVSRSLWLLRLRLLPVFLRIEGFLPLLSRAFLYRCLEGAAFRSAALQAPLWSLFTGSFKNLGWTDLLLLR